MSLRNDNHTQNSKSKSQKSKSGKQKAGICFLFSCFAVSLLFGADITAERLKILNTPEGKVTVFEKNVKINDRDTKIFSQKATFYEDKELALVYDSVIIKNPKAEMTCDTAYYYLATKRTNLISNVKVITESLQILSQNLTLNYGQDRASAEQGFIILGMQGKQEMRLQGQKGEYFFTPESGIITSAPFFQIQNRETVYVKSSKMVLANRTGYAKALDSVSVNTGNTFLTCETLTYFLKTGEGAAIPGNLKQVAALFGRDFVENRLTSDEIRFSTKDGMLTNLKGLKNCLGVYFTPEGDKVEIGADSLQIFFETSDSKERKVEMIQALGIKEARLYRKIQGVKPKT